MPTMQEQLSALAVRRFLLLQKRHFRHLTAMDGGNADNAGAIVGPGGPPFFAPAKTAFPPSLAVTYFGGIGRLLRRRRG